MVNIEEKYDAIIVATKVGDVVNIKNPHIKPELVGKLDACYIVSASIFSPSAVILYIRGYRDGDNNFKNKIEKASIDFFNEWYENATKALVGSPYKILIIKIGFNE